MSSNGLDVSVVVCDGNVDVVGRAYRSIVVARGDITVDNAANSTLIAGGRVTIREVPPPPRRGMPIQPVLVKEGDRNPLGFVQFFELSRVGLEVTDADKVVRIKSVADGKTFAASGAKVGDLVEGVNGAKPESAESLRRLLRDALAVGDATVTVRRGNAVHTLRVVLPE
ncbi:MAG TPA: PDZ domain-containing protein [Gemmataceae bacterium]|nr:PDZ domain-containing protein [Gemmataceae bacterium]